MQNISNAAIVFMVNIALIGIGIVIWICTFMFIAYNFKKEVMILIAHIKKLTNKVDRHDY